MSAALVGALSFVASLTRFAVTTGVTTAVFLAAALLLGGYVARVDLLYGALIAPEFFDAACAWFALLVLVFGVAHLPRAGVSEGVRGRL